MNLNSPSDRIVLSMLHRTRREFVEWTEAEIRRRSKTTRQEHDEAESSGLIHVTYIDKSATHQKCFQITEAGKARYKVLISEE